MKMDTIIVKQGFAVIVAFCYICLFRNPVITILKVAGCEDRERENKLSLRGPRGEAPCCWAIAAIFFEKKSRFNIVLHVFRASRNS